MIAGRKILDWDDAYANAAHIEDGEAYPARWAAAAAAFRAEQAPDRLRAGLSYGAHPRERLDLFLPRGRPAGLVVYVHGGYWRAFDRADWSHLAAGPLARGWAVAMPGYPLAPEARIAAITRAVAAAIAQAAAALAGPVHLTGHSAGGHLVARQVGADTGLPDHVRRRIGRVVSISGLFDLRPLMRTAINADLRLDAAEAQAESPALGEPLDGARLHAWVGESERPEFVRQSALIANVWTGLGAETTLTGAPGRHHFDVIAELVDPGSALVEALVGVEG
jgi:arylformamidase